jgi:hypothetical protein
MEQNIALIYNLLFCDDIKLYKDNFKSEIVYPWNILFSELDNRDELISIAKNPQYESRQRILAYNKLKLMDIKPDKKELLGIIIEVSLETGIDVLAIYQDNTARYINYSGKIIIWENVNDRRINNIITKLIQKGEQVILKIGSWDKNRLEPPKKGDVRLTFLASDGLYFGQGTFDLLWEDPLGGYILKNSLELMKILI